MGQTHSLARSTWCFRTCAKYSFSSELFGEISFKIIGINIKLNFVEYRSTQAVIAELWVPDALIISIRKSRIRKTLKYQIQEYLKAIPYLGCWVPDF